MQIQGVLSILFASVVFGQIQGKQSIIIFIIIDFSPEPSAAVLL